MKVQPNNERRAVSGVLAAVIFFAMLFTAGLSFVLFTFSSYNTYSKAQATAIQAAQAKGAESLLLRSCDTVNNQLPGVAPYTPPGCSVTTSGDVGVWVQNSGGVSVTITGVMIVDTSVTPNVLTVSPTTSPASPPFLAPSPCGSASCPLPYTLNPGALTVVDTGNTLVATHKYAITFITSTGNQFSSTYPPPPLGIVVPTLTTTLSNYVITQGGSASDTATLVGSTNGGSISFYYSTVSTCPNGGATQVGTNVAVSGEGNYPSTTSATFSSSGSYYWYATYTDSSGVKTTSPCEPLLVQTPSSGSKANPIISTSLFASTVSAGTAVTDSATFSVTGGAGPTGLVVFAAYPLASGCTGNPAYQSDPILVNGFATYGPSGPSFYPSVVGAPSYDFQAIYTGDNNYNPLITPCTSEPLTVTQATPTVATTLSNTAVIISQSVKDTATLAASSGSNAGGTVTFLYSSTNSCPSTAQVDSGTATSGGASTLTDASKSWAVNRWNGYTVAIVSGTGTGQTRVVSSNTATALTVSSAWTTVPDSTSAYVIVPTVSGLNLVGASAVSGGVAVSTPVSFSTTGSYYFYAYYSAGDANNIKGAVSTCEPLTVNFNISSSTFGIGALSFNFETFYYYFGSGSCSTSGPDIGCALTSQGRAYTILGVQSEYVGFSVQVTNVDPLGRTIVLDDQSYLLAPSLNVQTGGGNTIQFVYGIGTVTGGTVAAYTPVTIAPGATATVWFVNMVDGNPPGGHALSITPIYLLFHGTIGGQVWGENFPLTTIYWEY